MGDGNNAVESPIIRVLFGVRPVANKLHKFKDSDVQRVIKAAKSAGLEPTGVEVNPVTGAIRVITGKTVEAANDLDRELEAFKEQQPWSSET